MQKKILSSLIVSFLIVVVSSICFASTESKTFSQDLSASSLTSSLTVGGTSVLQQISIKASENITETITVKRIDAMGGNNYSVVLNTTSLSGESSFVFRPAGDCILWEDDSIEVSCTNNNTTGTVYGRIDIEKRY